MEPCGLQSAVHEDLLAPAADVKDETLADHWRIRDCVRAIDRTEDHRAVI